MWVFSLILLNFHGYCNNYNVKFFLKSYRTSPSWKRMAWNWKWCAAFVWCWLQRQDEEEETFSHYVLRTMWDSWYFWKYKWWFKILIIAYYLGCGHCKKAKPEYTNAAAKFANDKKVRYHIWFFISICWIYQNNLEFGTQMMYPKLVLLLIVSMPYESCWYGGDHESCFIISCTSTHLILAAVWHIWMIFNFFHNCSEMTGLFEALTMFSYWWRL